MWIRIGERIFAGDIDENPVVTTNDWGDLWFWNVWNFLDKFLIGDAFFVGFGLWEGSLILARSRSVWFFWRLESGGIGMSSCWHDEGCAWFGAERTYSLSSSRRNSFSILIQRAVSLGCTYLHLLSASKAEAHVKNHEIYSVSFELVRLSNG